MTTKYNGVRTITEVAQIMGISQQYASHLLASAIRKMKKNPDGKNQRTILSHSKNTFLVGLILFTLVLSLNLVSAGERI
jgi:hypothetical protein